MKRDIYKHGAWLEKACQEGFDIKHKVREWKLAEEKNGKSGGAAKAS